MLGFMRNGSRKKALSQGRLKIGNELLQNAWRLCAYRRFRSHMPIVQRRRKRVFPSVAGGAEKLARRPLRILGQHRNLVYGEFSLRLGGGEFRDGFDCGHFLHSGGMLRGSLNFSSKRF